MGSLVVFFPVPRSLVVYIAFGLVIASVVFAYQQSHQPHPITASAHLDTQRNDVMTALVATDYGGPEVLRLDRAYLRPVVQKPQDVLVKVSAASLNPADVKLSSGQGHHYFNWCRTINMQKVNVESCTV